MNFRKSAVAAFIATLGLMLPSLSSAALISDWKAQGDIIVGDKDFHFVSASSNLLSAPLDIGSPVALLYTLAIGDGRHAIVSSTGWTGSLQYTVTVLDPNFAFATSELDVTDVHQVGSTATISEAISGFTTLQSVNGSSDTGVIGGQSITVTDTFNVASGSAITSVQNTFGQVAVPEPGSLVVWTLGLVAFGGRQWLKRRKSKVATV